MNLLYKINSDFFNFFNCLQNLNISGNCETLLEIVNNIQKNKSNLKNIKFYLRDTCNDIDKITKKLEKKNITLKIIPIKKEENKNNNNNIEEEENEDYEYNEYEEDDDDENEYYDEYDDYDDEINSYHMKSNINNNNNKISKNNKKNSNDIICTNVNSEILNNQNLSIIKKGFQTIFFNKKIKSIDFTIKYRASLDGNTINDFINFQLYNNNYLLVVKTNKNQIFGVYGYLKRNGNSVNKTNFFFNITNQELKSGITYFSLNNEEINVYPYFKLGKSFFKLQNIFYKDNKVFSCKEVEIFEISLN